MSWADELLYEPVTLKLNFVHKLKFFRPPNIQQSCYLKNYTQNQQRINTAKTLYTQRNQETFILFSLFFPFMNAFIRKEITVPAFSWH